jgi:hypothetical protein
MKYHQKGVQEWGDDEWGKQEYLRKQEKAPKQEKKPKSKDPEVRKTERLAAAEARAERRTVLSEQLHNLREKTWNLFVANRAWDAQIFPIAKEIHRLQAEVHAQKNAKILELKGKGKHKQREMELHGETSRAIDTTAWTAQRDGGYLYEIEKYCKYNGLLNTLGHHLPDQNPDGSYYLSVTALFLSQAKQLIMAGTVHLKAKRAREGNADDDECKYVNLSYQANDILAKLQGKDKYPRNLDPKLPDTHAVMKWKNIEKELDGMLFHQLHPGKPLPKHLSMRPPKQEQGPGKKGKEHKEGKKHHGGQDMSFQEFMKMYGEYEALRHAKGKHHGHDKHHAKGQAGPNAGKGRGGGGQRQAGRSKAIEPDSIPANARFEVLPDENARLSYSRRSYYDY